MQKVVQSIGLIRELRGVALKCRDADSSLRAAYSSSSFNILAVISTSRLESA